MCGCWLWRFSCDIQVEQIITYFSNIPLGVNLNEMNVNVILAKIANIQLYWLYRTRSLRERVETYVVRCYFLSCVPRALLIHSRLNYRRDAGEWLIANSRISVTSWYNAIHQLHSGLLQSQHRYLYWEYSTWDRMCLLKKKYRKLACNNNLRCDWSY